MHLFNLLTNTKCKDISKYVPFSNPTKSYRTPAIDGPKNAPKANDDDQMPDNKPYVCMSFGKPLSLKKHTVPNINSIFFLYYSESTLTMQPSWNLRTWVHKSYPVPALV